MGMGGTDRTFTYLLRVPLQKITSRLSRLCLSRLCSAFVGGIAFFPASLQDVDAVAAEVARDIRNQYILAYYSARASTAGYHSVKVQARASGRGKLTVHTRTGYYSKQSPFARSKRHEK